MKSIISAFLIFFSVQQSMAQCTGCAFDLTCAASKPTGGLCRGDITGMVAHPYSKDVTIYMPTVISCAAVGKAGQCTYVELKQIKVASITSPQGISTTPNKTTYNILTGDTIGCIRFCGTPLAAGTFPISINLSADLIAHGTPGGDITLTDQAFPYSDTIIILADTTPNPKLTSFSYQVNGKSKNDMTIKKCDSAVLDSLSASINGDCNLATYFWNIESKGNFIGKKPITGALQFTAPDTISTTLKTQLYSYKIKKVEVGSVTGGYSELSCVAAMEECPGFGKPDLFITIDVAAINGRRNCGNSECDTNLNKDAAIQFNNINFIIPPSKCSTPFKLSIFDEDSAPFGTVLSPPASFAASADDRLDTYMVTPTLGTITLPNGTNTRFVKVTFDTVPTGPAIIETMDLIIHPKVTPTNITSSQDSFCNTQKIDLNVSNTGNFVEWYLDTNLLTGFNSNTLQISKGGNYKVKLTGSTGCSYTSNPKFINLLPFPDALTEYKKDTLKIQLFDLTKYNYDFYINDTIVPTDHNLPWILFSKTGFYKIKAYNKYCEDYSEALYYEKSKVAIDDLSLGSLQYRLIQNQIEWTNQSSETYTGEIFDMVGHLWTTFHIGANETKLVQVSDFPATVLLMRLTNQQADSKTIRIIK